MKQIHVQTAMLVAAMLPVCVANGSSVVESRVESIGLFKNGLAVITRIIEVDQPGTYVLEDVPLAVHGSFWLESDGLVAATTLMRNVEVPLDTAAGSNFREELMGREVTVRLREPVDAMYRGRVVQLEAIAGEEEWSRRYEVAPSYWSWWSWQQRNTSQPRVPAGALMLDDGNERHYINLDVIAAVTVHDAMPTMVRRQPVLELTVDAPTPDHPGPFAITMTYLAKGITWAPAYLARLTSEDRMLLAQQATIRNELEDIDDAEIYLISGFPNIQFSHVDSLAGPTATIAGFFSQLNQRVGGRHSTRRDVMSQTAVVSNVASPVHELDLDALAEAGSTDIFYQYVGRRSITAGSSIVFAVAESETAYDRIVEWIIPDDRDQYGRYLHASHMQQQEQEITGAWDAVRYRNPFSFPMTTAPIMVVDEGKFAGQRTSYWTNPGDRNTVQVTKALSVHTAHSDFELPNTRRGAHRFGRGGNIVTVRGTIELRNHRATQIDMVVRREFSGDLTESDESPDVRLLTRGVQSYNPRHELRWRITLEPGEVREITYEYDVFVPR